MQFYNACTFGFGGPRGFTKQDDWRRSLDEMFAVTGCDTLLLPIAALQDHAFSTQVDYLTDDVMSFEDAATVCRYAQSLGKKVILKAMVNCRDGYWRAYIRFFDTYVPTEPTWQEWFASYTAFCAELASLAQTLKADMFCVGCEMVGTDHREQEWRALVAEVRRRYDGLVVYNCDKFQEDHVTWWDCLDAISSSGYYPIEQLDEHFARIHAVADRFEKPFLFMECGCPSREGSEHVPNNWNFGGAQSNAAQRRWYEAFTAAMLRYPWVRGVGWWDWSERLYPKQAGETDDGYCVYGKPSAEVTRTFSERIAAREGR